MTPGRFRPIEQPAILALLAWLAVLLASSSAWAVEVQTRSEDLALEINALVQPRIEVDSGGSPEDAAPSGRANIDFYIRRAAWAMRGTAYQRFNFGVVVTAVRIGERGKLNASPFLQDVRVGYLLAKDVNVEMGLLFLPLTRAALTNPTQQSSIEGGADILLYNHARNLHDTGIQVRALLLDGRILVRGGYFEGARNNNPDGVPPLNPDGIPLAAGMVRWNLVGEEAPYAYPSIYLDEKTRISIGAGGHYQPHSGALRPGTGAYDDYLALAADLFADVALAPDHEAILMVGGYRFNYGAGNGKTGHGMQGEVGYRWGPVEPQGNFYWFNSDTKQNSYLKIAGGLNVFLQGHRAKIQAEYARIIANANLATTPPLHQVIVQTQLAF